MAASAQRYPRDILLETDAEYQRLAEQHSKYEAELLKLSATPYLVITVRGLLRAKRERHCCGIAEVAFVNCEVLNST